MMPGCSPGPDVSREVRPRTQYPSSSVKTGLTSHVISLHAMLHPALTRHCLGLCSVTCVAKLSASSLLRNRRSVLWKLPSKCKPAPLVVGRCVCTAWNNLSQASLILP